MTWVLFSFTFSVRSLLILITVWVESVFTHRISSTWLGFWPRLRLLVFGAWVERHLVESMFWILKCCAKCLVNDTFMGNGWRKKRILSTFELKKRYKRSIKWKSLNKVKCMVFSCFVAIPQHCSSKPLHTFHICCWKILCRQKCFQMQIAFVLWENKSFGVEYDWRKAIHRLFCLVLCRRKQTVWRRHRINEIGPHRIMCVSACVRVDFVEITTGLFEADSGYCLGVSKEKRSW